VSLSMKAQINKVTKNNLSIKPANSLKLPLLKAKSADKYREGDINRLKEVAFPKTILTAVPKPYSKSSSALNVTLTPNKMKTSDASLVFRGTYSNSRIRIYQLWKHLLGIKFKAKRNKIYRVNVKFYLFTNSNWCTRMGMPFKKKISIGGNSHEFDVKQGANSINFLIQSDVDGQIKFYPLTWYGIRCNGTLYKDKKVEFRFMSAQIQELQD